MNASLPELNRLRFATGLPALGTAEDQWLRPHLLLSFTAEPFEYPRRDWPATVRLVGPCAWEPPATPPAWVGELPSNVVLVATSSEFQADHRLIETAFEALAGTEYFVVATAPSGEVAAIRRPAHSAPGRIERFVPHFPVLAKSVCAVTHGDMGISRRRSPAAFRSAWSPSSATSSRSPPASTSPAPAPGSRRGSSRPRRCEQLFSRRSGEGPAPGASARAFEAAGNEVTGVSAFEELAGRVTSTSSAVV